MNVKQPNNKINLCIEVFHDDIWMGGAIYLRNVVYCLNSLPVEERPRVSFLGVTDPPQQIVTDLQDLQIVRSSYGSGNLGKVFPIWKKIFSRDLPANNEIKVVYPGFGKKRKDSVQLYWLPDFQHVYLPEYFDAEEIEARNKSIEEISKNDGILVLSSQTMLDDFKSMYPNAKITAKRWSFCSVLTDREREGNNPHDRYGLSSRYLYIPNQFWAHKDHMTALRAILILKENGIIIPLVCTGLTDDRRDPAYFTSLLDFINSSGLSDQVKILGLVPRKDQIEIFRHCTAVLQPSLFEGWSTVVEDAKAIGRPIILSDISVHKEQVTDNGWFFKRSSPEDLASVLKEIWPKLKLAPDKEAEKKAFILTEERKTILGKQFMLIVKEAIKLAGG